MKLLKQKILSRDIQLTLHSTSKNCDFQLLCIHGFLDHGRSFVGISERLQMTTQVHMLDRRGYGDSDKISVGRYEFFMNMVDLANTFATIRAAKTPTFLLGHSIGGLIALLYAGAFPEQLQGLILLDCFGIRDQISEAPDRLRDFVEQQSSEPRPGRIYRTFEAALNQLRSKHARIPESRLEQWGRDGLREQDGGWQFKADRRHKGKEPMLFREDLVRAHGERITCPTLALRGELSQIATFPAWLDTLNQCERGTIKGAGHMLHLEQEEAVATRISAFIEQIVS